MIRGFHRGVMIAALAMGAALVAWMAESGARRPFRAADGKSGSSLERVDIDGEPHVRAAPGESGVAADHVVTEEHAVPVDDEAMRPRRRAREQDDAGIDLLHLQLHQLRAVLRWLRPDAAPMCMLSARRLMAASATSSS